MNMIPPRPVLEEIVYPMSDGERMADNDKQIRWIAMLEGNLAAMFRHRDDVIVGRGLRWYPVEGQPSISAAPDVFVVLGRPKGARESYLQWEERNVPMTVVFELLPQEGGVSAFMEKFSVYREYGTEECYLYEPLTNDFRVLTLQRGTLRRIEITDTFVSPQLGIRFQLAGPELVVVYPDGTPFFSVTCPLGEDAPTE